MARVTLKDIARETGLTANTVSHALRDKDDISKATKNKVKKAAAAMGYVRNGTASSLRSGRTGIVGIVYDNLLNPYYAIMTHYLDESLTRSGYGFISFEEKSGDKIGLPMVKRLLQRNVDGIISFLEPDEDAAQLFAESVGVPLLVIGRHVKYDYIDYIYTDDRQGGAIAAEHLIERGYTKITFMTDTQEISCARERIEGYREVMRAHGLPGAVWVCNDTYTAAVDTLLAEQPPDAIICFNDMMAFEVLYALEKRGRKDVAVVGYDNIQNELKFPGQLTTVGYDKAQIADVAAEVLLYKISKDRAETHAFNKVHAVTLIEGVTTPQKPY